VIDGIRIDTTDYLSKEISRDQLAFLSRVVTRIPRYRFKGHTCNEWLTWRADFQQALWDILGVGDMPWRSRGLDELSPELEEQKSVDGIIRELIWIRVDDQLYIPVYLFLPPGLDSPRPAIIVFPGHSTIEQAAGIAHSYQNANALELARAGFITLAMEFRGFGLLNTVNHLRIDAAARLIGRTWYGLLVHDAMHAIDYLCTRPDVDASRIGATGIGAGGALTMYTAALDDRIQAALVHSYLSKYIVTSFDEDHCSCNDIPGIRQYADMGDVASLIAPRPVLFVNGLSDPSSNPAAHESFAVVSQVYRVIGAYNRAQLIELETVGHEYDNQLAIGWFRRWLTRGIDYTGNTSCPM
jgi:hypothetical protein